MDQEISTPPSPLAPPAEPPSLPAAQSQPKKKSFLKTGAIIGGALAILFIVFFGRTFLFRGMIFLTSNTQEACVAIGGLWNASVSEGERCANPESITTETDCTAYGGDWRGGQQECRSPGGGGGGGPTEPEPSEPTFSSYEDQTTCMQNGGLWSNGTCFDPGQTNPACSNMGGDYSQSLSSCQVGTEVYVLSGNPESGYTFSLSSELSCVQGLEGMYSGGTPPTCANLSGSYYWTGSTYVPAEPESPQATGPISIISADPADDCEAQGGTFNSLTTTCTLGGYTYTWNTTTYEGPRDAPPWPGAITTPPTTTPRSTDQQSCLTNGGLWFNNTCYDPNFSSVCAEVGGTYSTSNTGKNYCEIQGPYHGLAYVLQGDASTGFTLVIDQALTCTEFYGGPFSSGNPPTCATPTGEIHPWVGNGYLQACGGEGPDGDYTCEEWSACTEDPRGDLVQTRTCTRSSTGACAEVPGVPEIKRMCEEPTRGTAVSTLPTDQKSCETAGYIWRHEVCVKPAELAPLPPEPSPPSEPSDLESRLAGLQQSQAAAAAQGQDTSALQGQISSLQQQIASLQSQQQQPPQIIVQVPSAQSPAPAPAAPQIICPSGFTFDATRNACVATDVTVGVEPTEVTQGVGIVQEEETITTLQAEGTEAAEVSVAEASAPTTATAVGVAAQAAAPRAGTLHGAYIQGRTGPALLIYPALLGAANALWYFRRKRMKNK